MGLNKILTKGLKEKVKDRDKENCMIYFQSKENFEKLFEITTIPQYNAAKYIKELEKARREPDPADSFSKLGEVFKNVRMELLFSIGRKLLDGKYDNHSPEFQIQMYVEAGMGFLEEARREFLRRKK